MERRREHSQAEAGSLNGQPLLSPSILKELRGEACVSCGSPFYYLVLSVRARGHEASLAARCSCCHELKQSLSGDRVVQDIEGAAKHNPANSIGPRKRWTSVAGSHVHARTRRCLTAVATGLGEEIDGLAADTCSKINQVMEGRKQAAN